MTQPADDRALDPRAGVSELRPATGDSGLVPRNRSLREDLPLDRNQAILQAAKQVGAILKRKEHPFALAGSVAVYAHGGTQNLQHDVDFCIRPEDAPAVAETLQEAGLPVYTPPEDWLLKADCLGQPVDLIFELAHQPVTTELLGRAEELSVDSVLMPVLSPTDLLHGLLAAFSEHHCDFGAVLPIARTLREKIDWEELRRECGDAPMPAAFFFVLERLEIISPPEDAPEDAAEAPAGPAKEDHR
ncbi:nucleotidyltransferase family protein [Streptomyces sp. TRM S81-3]|uniref:Nucleotidyltransferase family protein n=1 Tax=Streptomyces griseicoloratus TaxID=2752516 RepID=A0A926QNN8_9ACTN|nr:nucleotidyltransferase family protein [Streptomyces griseicoloratus]MBD0418508.1 nucleotidyltransferase family protein [Streptomyces griseicoloratus]